MWRSEITIGFIACLNQPFLDRLSVEGQHIGREYRIRKAVMGVVERADRVREGVDRTEPLLERGRAGERRRHHVGARLEIAAVRDRAREILFHQPGAFERDAVRERVDGTQ
jgi:hypothetical protein